jgi:mono/diheme cytochrome c family protein/small nuclear ribonucleoprotein (snRNP)-like protein
MVQCLGDLHSCAKYVSALALLAISVFGQTTAEKKPAPSARMEHGREFLGLGALPDEQAAARGQTLFVQNCGFCHGANAKGGEGPDLVRSALVLHDEHGDQIGQVVQKGRPDRGMPAFPSFSQEQIKDIAEFLHSRVEAAVNRFGYKILNVVTGDPARGQAFFEQHCTACHSPEKDLAHIASRFEPQDLQAQFLYPALKEGGDGRTVTVTCGDGKQISGKLKSIDDFHVLFITSDGEFHRFATDEVKIELHDPLTKHRELLDQYTNADMHNVLAYLVTLK